MYVDRSQHDLCASVVQFVSTCASHRRASIAPSTISVPLFLGGSTRVDILRAQIAGGAIV